MLLLLTAKYIYFDGVFSVCIWYNGLVWLLHALKASKSLCSFNSCSKTKKCRL